jgi:hypothetical protein
VKTNRGLTSEEREKFHALESDYTTLENSIKLAEKSDSIAARLNDPDNRTTPAVTEHDVEQLRDEFKTSPRKQLEVHGRHRQ